MIKKYIMRYIIFFLSILFNEKKIIILYLNIYFPYSRLTDYY